MREEHKGGKKQLSQMVTSLHREKKKYLIAWGVLNTYAFPSSGKVSLSCGGGCRTFSFPAEVVGQTGFPCLRTQV